MVSTADKIAIFWFRRDLRIDDNTGFYHALVSGFKVLPIFIFDKDILNNLEDKDDGRVTFIHQVVTELKADLEKAGGTLMVHYGKPMEVWQQIVSAYKVAAVYTNHDYESYAIARDNELNNLLQSKDIAFYTFKDQVIFERKEIVNGKGEAYKMFTPYSKKWLAALSEENLRYYYSANHLHKLYQIKSAPVPTLAEMGFEKSAIIFPPKEIREQIVKEYAKQRNFPGRESTTRLGIHLRFGTVSVRETVKKAKEHSETWLNELIWRDFYMMILANFPQVEQYACKPAYDQIKWRNNEAEFERWCEGKTGYPIVDAGMRELNATDFMHNRVRMIAASFMVKHLLIDWRWGDAYFARKLLDYELATNNGSWQWIAGSGCDAAPYFRVFNPNVQATKFDKSREYIRKWVPEIGTENYPKPIIDHEIARERALLTYRAVLKREEVV